MPQRDPVVYLEDIEYYASAAVRFISAYSLEQYLADEKTRAALETPERHRNLTCVLWRQSLS